MTRLQTAQPGDIVRRGQTSERLVLLENATLHSFKLMASGEGFDLHIILPIEEASKLEGLTAALRRVVDVHVVRFSRKARRNGESYDWTTAYIGVDDDG